LCGCPARPRRRRHFTGGSNADEIDGGPDNDTFRGLGGIDSGLGGIDSPRLRFCRNLANIFMDCDGIEQMMFNAPAALIA